MLKGVSIFGDGSMSCCLKYLRVITHGYLNWQSAGYLRTTT